MYTNLQEGKIHEFKDKEGKWFSQIQGETTEWLDDGTGGNIDTNEFSYQGIDEAGDLHIISGGYTSWDCLPCVGWNGFYGLDLNNEEQGYDSLFWGGIYSSLGLGAPPNPTPHYQQASGQVFTTTMPANTYSSSLAALQDVITQIWEYFWQNPVPLRRAP